MTAFKKLTVSSDHTGERLDQYLASKFPEYSRSYFTKLIKKKYVLVNGVPSKSGYTLHDSDQIEVTFFVEQSDLEPADLPLNIVHEDEDIIVINNNIIFFLYSLNPYANQLLLFSTKGLFPKRFLLFFKLIKIY